MPAAATKSRKIKFSKRSVLTLEAFGFTYGVIIKEIDNSYYWHFLLSGEAKKSRDFGWAETKKQAKEALIRRFTDLGYTQ